MSNKSKIGERPNKKNIESLDLTISKFSKALTCKMCYLPKLRSKERGYILRALAIPIANKAPRMNVNSNLWRLKIIYKN